MFNKTKAIRIKTPKSQNNPKSLEFVIPMAHIDYVDTLHCQLILKSGKSFRYDRKTKEFVNMEDVI